MKKCQEKELLEEFYNLILNPDISNKERQILLKYKDRLGNVKNLERAFQDLAGEIRRLSLKNLSSHERLSEPVANFYKKIAYIGQVNSNLGRGLMSLGIK